MAVNKTYVCDICRLAGIKKNYLSIKAGEYTDTFVCNDCKVPLFTLLHSLNIETVLDDTITTARVYIIKFKKQLCTPPPIGHEHNACCICGVTCVFPKVRRDENEHVVSRHWLCSEHYNTTECSCTPPILPTAACMVCGKTDDVSPQLMYNQRGELIGTTYYCKFHRTKRHGC